MTGIKTIEDLIKNSTLIGIDPDKDIKDVLNKPGYMYIEVNNDMDEDDPPDLQGISCRLEDALNTFIDYVNKYYEKNGLTKNPDECCTLIARSQYNDGHKGKYIFVEWDINDYCQIVLYHKAYKI